MNEKKKQKNLIHTYHVELHHECFQWHKTWRMNFLLCPKYSMFWCHTPFNAELLFYRSFKKTTKILLRFILGLKKEDFEDHTTNRILVLPNCGGLSCFLDILG